MKVEVLSTGFEIDVMFLEAERGRGVHVAIEAEEVTHTITTLAAQTPKTIPSDDSRCHGVVHHDIHPSSMNLGNGSSPLFDVRKMPVQESEVQRTIAIRSPRGVDER